MFRCGAASRQETQERGVSGPETVRGKAVLFSVLNHKNQLKRFFKKIRSLKCLVFDWIFDFTDTQ